MDPAHAEADSGRAEAVAQRDQRGLADARDHDAVQLDAIDELLEERLVGRRLGDRLSEVALELLARLDAKDGALAARVDRLQDRREGDLLERGVDIRSRAQARVRRLRKAGCTEGVTHRALVRQEVSRLRPDAGKPELLGDSCDDRNCSIGGNREHAVDADPARDLHHGADIAEVDDLCDIGRREAGGVGVAIDGCDAQAARAGLLDRAALVAPGADEEDGLHGRRW